jgi:hypothetical protein
VSVNPSAWILDKSRVLFSGRGAIFSLPAKYSAVVVSVTCCSNPPRLKIRTCNISPAGRFAAVTYIVSTVFMVILKEQIDSFY